MPDPADSITAVVAFNPAGGAAVGGPRDRARRSGAATPPGDALVQQMLEFARRHALRQKVAADQIEDCAGEFVLRLLRWHARNGDAALPRDERGLCPPAWLHCCADNHVKDFCRKQAVQQRRLVLWADLVWSKGTHPHGEAAEPAQEGAPAAGADLSNLPDPHGALTLDTFVLQAEFWVRVRRALSGLKPETHALLVRHVVGGESFIHLGQATGKSPDAVRKSVARALQQVACRLASEGQSEADAQAYPQQAGARERRTLPAPEAPASGSRSW